MHESNWYFNKFSPLLLLKKYNDSKWESQIDQNAGFSPFSNWIANSIFISIFKSITLDRLCRLWIKVLIFVCSSVLSIASKRALTLPPCQTPCKGSQDSLGFWISRRVFRISGSWFQSLSVKLGFWIPILSRIPDSLRCIPDSIAQDSGFYKQKFHGFRNTDSITWSDPSFDKYFSNKEPCWRISIHVGAQSHGDWTPITGGTCPYRLLLVEIKDHPEKNKIIIGHHASLPPGLRHWSSSCVSSIVVCVFHILER